MAKRTGGGEVDAADLRRLLVAAVVEYGKRKPVGPFALTIPGRALRAATPTGTWRRWRFREAACS